MKTKRICLWSGPRNISTTLMYSFAQRLDTQVFDEPLYGHYLKNTKAKTYHPAAQEILSTMENDGKKVIDMMLNYDAKPIVFFKQMTHHLLDLDRSFMKDCINIILTRDPAEMLPSFDNVIHNPSLDDVGYALHTDLVHFYDQHDIDYIVLNAKNVLLNPKKLVTQLCDLIGITFDQTMLHWTAGARPEDGVWAKHWYSTIHRSTGFIPYKPKTTPFPEHLEELLQQCLPHYEKLNALSLK